MAVPGGRAALEAAMAGLPKWVVPMLILDQTDDAQTADLANEVRDILAAVGALRARSARRGARRCQFVPGLFDPRAGPGFRSRRTLHSIPQ